jgi:hypothetical protein
MEKPKTTNMEFENAVASQNWKTLILVLWEND